MRLIFSSTFLVMVLLSCTKKEPNHFADPVLIKIADLQDKRTTDSLLSFLHSENAVYRKAAVLALASVQDSLAAPSLGSVLLEDQDADVRRAAAFALGQTGTFASANSLIPSLQDKDHLLVSEALKAAGKCFSKNDVGILLNYPATDSLTTEGLSWSFYQLGLRNLSDSLIENKAKTFLEAKYSYQTRLGAAHFFSRSKRYGHSFEEVIIEAAQNDQSPEVRMASASALKKVRKEKALSVLADILDKEKDERVRVGAVRSLSAFPVAETLPLLMKALVDKNIHVAIASSEVIKNVITPDQKPEILKAISSANWRVQANLYEAILSVDPSDKIVEDVKAVYNKSQNHYQKAALLLVLARVTSTYPFIGDELIKTKVLVIKSAAAQALTKINGNKDFDVKQKPAFAQLYEQAILDGDVAVMGTIASALSDSTFDYRSIIKDYRFLQTAKKKLSLPKDYEALHPLEEAIAYFEGRKKPEPPKNQYNHPINWELVKSIKKDQEVLITTTKGEIILQLHVEDAPGSVANYVDLVRKKYFDQKFVHRVVPNFVIQAGCYRGDGYGSEDYSIRSEFPMKNYKTGSVGMASAGKDTEGTQWFITHSPTPHLDGRYTLFADVLNGMEVVDALEVGDQILTVTLID